MPRRKFVQIQLPAMKPDCCNECPLLGLVPKHLRQPGSKETCVCCGTLDALNARITRVRASERDKRHPLRRPCDSRWDAWQTLPLRRLGISTEVFTECRVPWEMQSQLQIKFHNRGRK